MEVVSCDNWSYKTCKAPGQMSPSTNQHPTFYRPDALPDAQPTVSKHQRENYQVQLPSLTFFLLNCTSVGDNYLLSFRQHFPIASAEFSENSESHVCCAVWSVVQTAPQSLQVNRHTHISTCLLLMADWLVFNGTFSTNRLYRAIGV